jgi:hypothetical protein
MSAASKCFGPTYESPTTYLSDGAWPVRATFARAGLSYIRLHIRETQNSERSLHRVRALNCTAWELIRPVKILPKYNFPQFALPVRASAVPDKPSLPSA